MEVKSSIFSQDDRFRLIWNGVFAPKVGFFETAIYEKGESCGTTRLGELPKPHAYVSFLPAVSLGLGLCLGLCLALIIAKTYASYNTIYKYTYNMAYTLERRCHIIHTYLIILINRSLCKPITSHYIFS